MIQAFSVVWFAVAFLCGATGPATVVWLSRRRDRRDWPRARALRAGDVA